MSCWGVWFSPAKTIGRILAIQLMSFSGVIECAGGVNPTKLPVSQPVAEDWESSFVTAGLGRFLLGAGAGAGRAIGPETAAGWLGPTGGCGFGGLLTNDLIPDGRLAGFLGCRCRLRAASAYDKPGVAGCSGGGAGASGRRAGSASKLMGCFRGAAGRCTACCWGLERAFRARLAASHPLQAAEWVPPQLAHLDAPPSCWPQSWRRWGPLQRGHLAGRWQVAEPWPKFRQFQHCGTLLRGSKALTATFSPSSRSSRQTAVQLPVFLKRTRKELVPWLPVWSRRSRAAT